jgi:hypothetical protein
MELEGKPYLQVIMRGLQGLVGREEIIVFIIRPMLFHNSVINMYIYILYQFQISVGSSFNI